MFVCENVINRAGARKDKFDVLNFFRRIEGGKKHKKDGFELGF